MSILVLFQLSAEGQVSVRDVNGDYLTSVTPNTSISYILYAPTLVVTGCDVTWVTTNAQGLPDGVDLPSSGITYGFKWKNVSGNAVLKGTFRNCNTSTTNGKTATLSVPIRYLGNIGSILFNGFSTNPQTLGCGSQTVTLSVGSAVNATSYYWDLSNLSGWSINSGQGTNSITATSAAGSSGQVVVTATRSDALNTSSSTSMNINRPSLSSVSITGSNQGCFNQSGSYSLAGLGSAASTVWSASSPLSIAGSSSTNVTINYGGSNGYGTITAQITDGCNNTATRTLNVGVGAPNISTVNWDGSPNSGPVPANSGSTHYFNAVSSNSPSANYSLSVTNNFGNINTSLSGVNGGNAQVYVYGTNGNSSININASNVCGSKSAALIVYIPSGFRAAPNPAKESMTVAFTDTEYQEALPDQLEIVSEKTSKSVRSVDIKDVFKNHGFQEGNKIVFDVKDLPRGVYYLKIINSRQEKDKQVETIRLVFE